PRGTRACRGLLQPHLIRASGITAGDFSLALAVQNLLWGATQPFVGMLADRHGARPIMVAGVLVYAGGLALSVVAASPLVLMLGWGVCIGLALSCTASTIAMSVT